MLQTLLFFGPEDAVSQSVTAWFATNGFAIDHITPDSNDFLNSGLIGLLLKSVTPYVIMLYPKPLKQGVFLETTTEDWDAALQTIEAVTYLLQASAQRLNELGRGRILVLSHVAALAPFRGLSLVGTTLTAVTALIKMVALELAPCGVTVNAVAVGPLLEGLPEASKARLAADTPLGTDTGLSLAKLCLFLASEAADYITGQTMPVDGGFLLTRGSGLSPYAG